MVGAHAEDNGAPGCGVDHVGESVEEGLPFGGVRARRPHLFELVHYEDHPRFLGLVENHPLEQFRYSVAIAVGTAECLANQLPHRMRARPHHEWHPALAAGERSGLQ